MDGVPGSILSSTNAAGLLQPKSGGLQFLVRLEDYLDAVRKNHPVSSTIPDELREKKYEAASALASSNIRSLRMFSGYTSGLSYDKKGRFIAGVSEFLRHQSVITGRYA